MNTNELLKKIKLIEIKTKHARAFFPGYGDMSDAFARNEVVAWFQGRSEYGPRALGHRLDEVPSVSGRRT